MAKRTLRETKRSELLRRAVADAQEVSKLPWVSLNMEVLVSGNRKHCEVCLAGAVMLRLSQRDALQATYIECFAEFREDPSLLNKLAAIDRMREGTFTGAHMPDLPTKSTAVVGAELVVDAAVYKAVARASRLIVRNFNDKSGRAPWRVYLQAARVLEQAGL